MTPLEDKKLLTIIAPSELQELVLQTVRRCGVGGYTMVPATGSGASGLRTGAFASDTNTLIYIIMSEPRLVDVLENLEGLMRMGYRLKALVSDIAILPRKAISPD